MNTPATAFLYIGIIVLALAVIAIVVWVAMLSNRIKRLSDRMMYDANAQPAPRSSVHAAQQSPAVTGPYGQQPMQPMQAMQTMQSMQATMSGPAVQPYPQSGQTVRSVQPAVARVHTNPVQPMQQPDDGQAFFDGYRAQSESQQTGGFRREKPSIPFGADRAELDRRESYTRDAVDTEYDPDSIDFSRVAGYRHIRQ